ncbi:uncharacterized protein SPAPADRAFT_51626 [Spathaspora passalidarum NRRL Y-27907]|uniref:DNA polymerase n=1 Tax=Spathaspora passalidarum (strain NRRL Y-27907 / 11-Y1) TaxID=619300 RepID=G3AQT7_SPAPN|nr:uncharacterized protein SPAPADRAFT_51626 [Spathaspora passalidarum NRRL Y-27907]EGW31634.1 hypothetical protein SPAPADRAFT_51626 [Spathaspora passalidarum NRRL Y-27907]
MSSRAAKLQKLKELREARKTGRTITTYSDDDDHDGAIYDEVDEETYRQHKRDQLMNDDFVVDDGGEGYVDNGADEWDDASRPNYYSDEEDQGPTKKRKKQKVVKVSKSAQINNYFKPTTRVNATTKIDTNIDDILDDFQEVTSKKKKFTTPFSTIKKGSPKVKSTASPFDFSTTGSRRKRQIVEEFNASSDYTVDEPEPEPEQQPSSPIKMVKSETPETITKPILEEVKSEDITMEDDDDDSEDDVVYSKRPRASATHKHTIKTVSSVKADEFTSSPTTLFANHTDKLDESIIMDTESTDSFKMFWLDYCEVDNTLLLFGKILTKDGKLASGVVQVNGLCRELYFLPRKYRMENGEENEDEPVGPLDVLDELTPILLEQYNLQELKAKPETMKYAFELAEIPKETEYLKVLLPFKTPKNQHMIMPANIEGETFNHVFGTNQNIFEAFVTQRNVMGPCWLTIEGGDFHSIQNTSHCQVEVAVDSPSQISVISGVNTPQPPNLTITSISVQTMMNPKENKQEIVSVSLATYYEVPQDAPIDENLQPNDIITLVRPVQSSLVPVGLQQLANKTGLKLRICPNEKVLLNCLAAMVKSHDPDVFIGHRLENISLDVLVHRMHAHNVTTWSAFGRRNRKRWPHSINKSGSGFSNNLLIREIFAGRLLCDIANEMGQSLTMKCQSWDLHEMFQVVLGKTHAPLEINFMQPGYSEDSHMLLMALKENEFNVKVTAEIAFAIQILSLSKQLTNIAGNAWSHTLSGTRAGRNEYILVHEFKRNNYIVPDKQDQTHKNTSYNQEARLENIDDDATTATSNKKPKYQGGLVFEPEKGLHKNYILVMDFNSLYPSIIQEFNICFTTVDRDRFNVSHDEDRDLPVLPERESEPGVLPRLLNTLVSRRREVKKLLKDPKNTPFQRAQYDIKQQALKLTANSMYGCLGYVNSRFYAKPLAMLVTNKGREILMDTRQLAESSGLRVVYGDTDSVMIDTGADNFQHALKVGEEFKIQVNERYRLLEIDIDNVFKRLLLHAKKKYAAMNVSIKNGVESTSLEVKGLDMRRREYCQLSKDISTFVLMKILSNMDPEQALSEIYDYLEDQKNKIISNEILMDKFKINTRLSKDPANYPNGKSMPQVQVALRLRKQGKVIKAGNVVTYVITSPADDSDKSTASERARSIQEVITNKDKYKPDAMYYLEKQIFAPVERLLERIEGVDMMRVATSLGIDTKKYILRVRNSDGPNGEIAPLESNISDSERFRQSSYLVLKCKCGHSFRFGGIVASKDYKVSFNGVTCLKCDHTFSVLKLTAQLEQAIRHHIALYYSGWLICDDPACGIMTRQISVYGRRCIGSSGKAMDCKGVMRYRYSDKALYNQLLYFDSIFNIDKAKKNQLRPIEEEEEDNDNGEKKQAPLAQGQVNALAEQNSEMFGYCQAVVQKYLAECGRRYVNMGSIFEFMAR